LDGCVLVFLVTNQSACENKPMPSSCINFFLGHEEWIPTLYIYSPEEEMACQKNTFTNGTNFCRIKIPRMKSRSMCWTY
jgi:hypothetical protein